jgi:hypothetical protein
MTQRSWLRYRWMRRVALGLAVAPLFQFSACATGITQVTRDMLNGAPASFFQMVNGLVILPVELLLGGGSNNNGSGGNSGGLGGTGF